MFDMKYEWLQIESYFSFRGLLTELGMIEDFSENEGILVWNMGDRK